MYRTVSTSGLKGRAMQSWVKMKLNTKQLQEISNFAIDQSVDGILLLDSSGLVHRVNDTLCRMTGYTREDFLSLAASDVNPLFTQERISQFFGETFEQNKVSFESYFRKKDGVTFPIEVTNNYVEFSGQKFSLTIIRDITSRKKTEDDMTKSEQKLRAILNNHYQLTGLMAIDGRLLMANETALNLTGLKEAEVIGRFFWDTLWWNHSPALQTKLKAAVKKAAQGKFVRFETEHPDANGKLRYVDFSLTPLRLGKKGKIEFIIPEGRDITKIKQTELKLKNALKEVYELKNQLQDENIYLQEEIKIEHNFNNMIGIGKIYRGILGQIEQVASTEANVLILGESGTGKELVARAVHELSLRNKHPMVKVNCATLPANLIESELFGHEKGAFTGALMRKVGRFELADKGTLFLDEIGELPLELQPKLLRILQEGEFERLGNPHTFKIDVRVIAATNRDLQQLVESGEFREDLYYRLNVFPILCQPLRERKEDIPVLVRHFIDKYGSRTGKQIDSIPQRVMDAFLAYSWPGNIRELENIVERALIISRGNKLEIGPWLEGESAESQSNELLPLEENERRHILSILQKTGWQVSGEKGAAKILNINAQTLVSRMKKLGIKRPS